jgi:hypothetical protein
MPETARQQKITFGEMRKSGLDRILIYCADYNCSRSIEMSADRWPDHIRLSGKLPFENCLRGVDGPFGDGKRRLRKSAGSMAFDGEISQASPIPHCGFGVARMHRECLGLPGTRTLLITQG